MSARVILLHRSAPPMPSPGQPCNGCGVCCAAEPCPLGQWLSRRRHGACEALQWRDEEARYGCGALDDPGRWLPWVSKGLARTLARRWIAAGQGCDCTLAAAPAAAEDGCDSGLRPPAPAAGPPDTRA